MTVVRPEDVARVRELIESGDLAALDAILEPLHAADLADILRTLERSAQIAILQRIDTDRAADVLTELDQQSGQSLLLLLSDRDVVDLLGEMPSDDAADMMSTLPPEKTERIGALLPDDDRRELEGLMKFDEDTAGGIMEVERVAVPLHATVQDAINIVRAGADDVENLQKIYVVDERGELRGQLNVLDLIMQRAATPVADAMDTAVIRVPVDMDQEQVANLFGKYDAFTLPVVDAAGVLVGRITVDDIIDVMEEEATEDIALLAGTTEDELGETSVLRVSRTRLPWLVAAMLGEALNAVVMSHHRTALETFVVLAFFIPLIVATAGNVGIQSSVVVVREIALGHVDLRHVGRRVLRELTVALANGVVLGAILFCVVWLWQRNVGLGGLLFVSLFCVVLVAAFMGASVPLLLNRWKVDPAIAAGPFVTLSNDIVGLAIYLSLASAYLARFG